MSICRLSDDSLWLHSPLKLNEELKGELDWLGAVRFVVSPNKLHPLFIGDYFAAYPETRIYAPPGLPEKRPELPFHSVLGYAPEPGWAEDLGQMVFRGYRYMEEVVFLHRQSHTMILADLLQSAHSDSPRLTRLVARLYGTYGKPRVPPAIKFMFRNKAAARASLERVLSWDFERIVIAHGHIIETGDKAIFRNAYSFLL